MPNREPTSEQKHILIVDDSHDMRDLLAQILEEEYRLAFAETGPQAIELANTLHPDLILMDISLPGMSGWEAIAHIRSRPEIAHIPIVAVTAHVTQTDRDRAFALGCVAHIGKPFDVSYLFDVVTKLLEKQR